MSISSYDTSINKIWPGILSQSYMMKIKLWNNNDQNRAWVRFDPKPKVDKLLKKHWDPSKSAAANLQNVGLSDDPNIHAENDNNNNNKKNAIEILEIPAADTIELGPSRRQQFPLNKQEEKYIVHCMEKYGTNYIKMFRDTKINYLQHTCDKLEAMGTKFLELQPHQRSIQELPDKVQKLINNTTTAK